MIVKIINRGLKVVDQIKNCEQEEISFLDGFDYLTKRIMNIKDTESQGKTYPSSYFTYDNSQEVIVLWLMKNGNIVRYLVIDMRFDVYLMSDTGKTIERIN